MMAHYAFLDENNIVTDVIVGRDEDDLQDGIESWEIYYGNVRNQKCLRTSYNTYEGNHLGGNQPFRGNYACVGFSYNEELDAFISPKPFASWVFAPETYSWKAPSPKPDNENSYLWNEESQTWELAEEAS